MDEPVDWAQLLADKPHLEDLEKYREEHIVNRLLFQMQDLIFRLASREPDVDLRRESERLVTEAREFRASKDWPADTWLDHE